MKNGSKSMATRDEIIRKCKALLGHHYGSQFKGLVLYGSVARNQAEDASDIDLLVLLNSSFNYFRELRQLVEVLYPLQLESEWLISAKPVATDDFEQGRLQLYRTAKREGVMV